MSDAPHEPSVPPLTDAETQPLEYVIVPKGDQAVPTQESSIQEYRAAIETLFEHSMTEEEAACFRPEMASKFVPLSAAQTRLLPPRVK